MSFVSDCTFFLLLIVSFCQGAPPEWRKNEEIDAVLPTSEMYVCERDSYYYMHNATVNQHECPTLMGQAKFQNGLNDTGMSRFEFDGSHQFDQNEKQFYLAGYAEGHMTRELISNHLFNTVEGYCTSTEEFCGRLQAYMRENLLFMRERIDRHPNDVFWNEVNFTLAHIAGLIDGYEGVAPLAPRSDLALVGHPLYLLQFFSSDLPELEKKFGRPAHVAQRWRTGSLIVKHNYAKNDLYVAHSTADSLALLPRIGRRLSFLTDQPGRRTTASTHPGTLSPSNELLVNARKLAVASVSIPIHNDKLMPEIQPASVPTWIRSQVAMRQARSAGSWMDMMKRHNSGTGSAQYAIVDYSKIPSTPGREGELPSYVVTLVEQIPSHFSHVDLSEELNEKMFVSTGIPFFTVTDVLSGNAEKRLANGDEYDFYHNKKALFATSMESGVDGLLPTTKLMRMNVGSNPCNALMPRCDIPADQEDVAGFTPIDHVGLDVKMIGYDMAQTNLIAVKPGTTSSRKPHFAWSRSDLENTVRHRGLPDSLESWKFVTLNRM